MRVFGHFLKIVSFDLAENPYLDRLDHYLQLSNWSHVQENSKKSPKLAFCVIFVVIVVVIVMVIVIIVIVIIVVIIITISYPGSLTVVLLVLP